MKIPLPNMMRHWREREFERHLSPATWRWGLGVWAWFARHPRLYQFGTKLVMRALGNLGSTRGRFSRLPLAGGWTKYRDLPAPQGQTFQELWAERRKTQLSAREAVFGKIRRSLGVSGAEPARNAAVDNRLRTRPRGVVPARGQLPAAERLALFTRLAEHYSASVARVANGSQVPAAVAEFLRQRNLPAAVRMGDDKRLAAMPWGETQIEMKHGAADGNDAVSVGHAFAGGRRIRHPGAHLRRGQPDDAQLPAGDGRSSCSTPPISPATTRRCGTACGSGTGEGRCRARSTASTAHRAPPTSSRRCCWVPTGRAACTSSSWGSGEVGWVSAEGA